MAKVFIIDKHTLELTCYRSKIGVGINCTQLCGFTQKGPH